MSNAAARTLSPLSDELGSAELGDRRRTRRLGQIVDTLSLDPARSFPDAAGSDAELEALYRFLRNDEITPEAVLAPHREATARRAEGHAAVVVAHDTTTLTFGGVKGRKGLGRLHRQMTGRSMLLHVALAIGIEGVNRHALGVLSAQTLVRSAPVRVRKKRSKRLDDPTNEARRWHESVEQSEQCAGRGASLVHVMDREGDAYELLLSLDTHRRRFVVRAAHDRALNEVADEAGRRPKMLQAIDGAAVVAQREVPISVRAGSKLPMTRRLFPARDRRMARLAFRAMRVEFTRPSTVPRSAPATLTVNVVDVCEIDAPEGLDPVRWTLLTSEPIDTAEQLLQIVDWYRARWTIEEYFKALKKGCAVERRQLESRKTIEVALSIFLPLAWRLLHLRSVARDDTDRPATDVLTPTQVEILVATSKGALPPNPSVRQAMLAIAKRGGHIRNNGDPGWQILGRGYQALLLIEVGWLESRKTLCLQGNL